MLFFWDSHTSDFTGCLKYLVIQLLLTFWAKGCKIFVTVKVDLSPLAKSHLSFKMLFHKLFSCLINMQLLIK